MHNCTVVCAFVVHTVRVDAGPVHSHVRDPISQVLEGAAASKAGKAYDVVAPELADVNPDAETLAARHPVDADGHNLVATGGARKTVGPGGAVAGDAESQNQHPNNRVKKLRATSARRPSARFERIQSAHAVAGGCVSRFYVALSSCITWSYDVRASQLRSREEWF